MEISDLTQNFIDLCSPSPKRKPKGRSANLPALHIQRNVFVSSDEPSSGSDSETLVVSTPIRRRFKIESPDRGESLDGSQSVIDLSTPNQVSVMPIKREIKAEKPDPPHVIDIRTPESNPVLMDSKSAPATHSLVKVTPGIVRLGALFHSWEEARDAVYAHEECLGHCWRIGQSKMDTCGNRKKVTLQCNHYRQHLPIHSVKIDLADHRKGKSIRTSCEACVNVNRIQDAGIWKVTLTEWEHNHPREIPEDGSIRRPVTKEQKVVISQLASATTQQFSRGQIAEVLNTQTGEHKLKPCQISNVMSQAQWEAKDEVERLGGDMNAISDVQARLGLKATAMAQLCTAQAHPISSLSFLQGFRLAQAWLRLRPRLMG
ncbi:uncharacterized protein LACBIDRAFT_297915 [Laccaria bicolor S238N-H82]|uniref:Predicted protein n=1 Tax=Laccaria bicolor (strain S238N-H82 / ATCC MYA-4686) TaxID=486041 RepID=B0DB73_LACBS|nr:uncharacterized protein LACBIDRAFT_297915 [Laccaria bicolor S238N-H82]EDR08147.1 predicted protein [Laccaria bicolor S238N-H82]|eukprot:XP_001881217.1 predicted protein [Laccaria bicolor S238N-H82]